MRKLLTVLAASVLFFCPLHGQDLEKNPPVKVWKEVKYVGNKPVEVIKIKLKSGEVVEIYPTVKEVPKPVSALPKSKSKILVSAFLFLSGVLFSLFLIVKRRSA